VQNEVDKINLRENGGKRGNSVWARHLLFN